MNEKIGEEASCKAEKQKAERLPVTGAGDVNRRKKAASGRHKT